MSFFHLLIYIMFFLSGASALIYQVAWVRSLSLIFGGSHLAVTVVLSTFMAGLALGGYLIGRYSEENKNPLRLYGLLEVGIGLSAVLFIILMGLYPSIYRILTSGREDSTLFVLIIRILFSFFALLIPTTFMGGTLPVLTRFVSRQPEDVRGYLSFLYSFNTFGAIAGAALAGFVLLPNIPVSRTLYIAICINLSIGLLAILIGKKGKGEVLEKEGISDVREGDLSISRLILIGIGISGFCALGYEVLWTRVLTMVVGASVYSFTTMLIAFLSGIAMGSAAFGLLPRVFKVNEGGIEKSLFSFGLVQVIIGISALLVTINMRNLPVNSIQIQRFFSKVMDPFEARQWSNITLAFLYMVFPAFFMGVAFPLAGKIYAVIRGRIGSAVGDVLAYNTVGAILGAGISGFFLIYLLGIERGLEILILINTGFGIFVILNLFKGYIKWASPVITILFILYLVFVPDSFRLWDSKYFAIFRANQPEAFKTKELIKEAKENTEVLYYKEGVEANVSSIKVKGGHQAFLTNGRVEASDHLGDLQVQYTLGHLPMLLNRNPEDVLVIGLGSGVTLGSTSVHPEAKSITLVELAPEVVGVARTFSRYNHDVLNNPKIKIIFNDGRNHLLTTNKKYDVITADPIHPWFRGAGYLYTKEYFEIASSHLKKGGIMCQWLPIYELTIKDLRSIVRTFRQSFKYTMLWLIYYDSVLIGSNEPIYIDEQELEKRISNPVIKADLDRVFMGSAWDLLSYFGMGTQNMDAFSEGGVINTDDNLYLEFSAPLSIGKGYLMRDNLAILVGFREDILPYFTQTEDRTINERRKRLWESYRSAFRYYDPAHIYMLAGDIKNPELLRMLKILEERYPDFAPGRFLRKEYGELTFLEPRLLQKIPLLLIGRTGEVSFLELSAVLAPVSREKVAVIFVDNDARIVYGQVFFSGIDTEETVKRFAGETLLSIQNVYHEDLKIAKKQGRMYPDTEKMIDDIKRIIEEKKRKYEAQ